MNFGARLRTIRAARGLSQKDLAKLTGIPNTYISDMETGKMLPNPEWEARIHKALDWPEDAETAFAILAGDPHVEADGRA